MGFFDRLLRRPPILHVAHDSGTGPRDERPVVVLVHGIASSSVAFENLLPLLEPHHRCIAIDLLGFGESPLDDDSTYTLGRHADALHRTLSRLSPRTPFTLVGHSLGSLIATRYTALHPDDVRHLVMVSPPIYLRPSSVGDPVMRTRMGLYFAAYEYLRGNKEFTTMAARALASIAPIKNVLEVSERNWRPFVLSLQNAVEAQTTFADLASVEKDVDVVYGTLDPFLAPGGIKLIEQLRRVTVTRVTGVDHLIRPRLAEEIERVVRDYDGAGGPAQSA